MPKRTDINKILILGSGPSVIGQAGEQDDFALRAIRALHEEGYQVVMVNPNPAAVSTEPDAADAAYIEPLTVESIEKIMEKERPDALLTTVGGQTALYLAVQLAGKGILSKYGVQLIGADEQVIACCEDRMLFKQIMSDNAIDVPEGCVVGSIEDGVHAANDFGFPVILKPAYTIGGAGSSMAYNIEEFMVILAQALQMSPVSQVLIERSVAGWKEIELQVMRDSVDHALAVTTLEDVGPVGVHSGDSTTVIPAQTLTQDQLDKIDCLAKRIAGAVGITGTATVRFALNPDNGRVLALGINPAAGRSTTLASEAANYPAAEVAAKLAVGITLDEIGNAACKPEMDCVAVKVSRFAFEQFPGADATLGTSMKSVGEVMAFGQSFKEALQKGIRSLGIGRYGLGSDGSDLPEKERHDIDIIIERLARPGASRLFYIRYAIENGMDTVDIHALSNIDPWFIENIRELVEFERNLVGKSLVSVPADILKEAKQLGYSDVQLAYLLETDEEQVRTRRKVLGVESTYHTLKDCGKKPFTCYSTYNGGSDEIVIAHAKKVILLGGGPNRIGLGAEYDYSLALAAEAVREEGYESIIINCNPEAVYTSNKLYFEPLALENVLSIYNREKPEGVIVQFGGRFALNLSAPLVKAKIPILGTLAQGVDYAKNRQFFTDLARNLNLRPTECGTAVSEEDALAKANKAGYPLLVRSSDAIAADIVYDDDALAAFVERANASNERPVLLDKFIEDAISVEVDVVSDTETTLVCGVMEHIEQAGVHSGDSAHSLPPHSLSPEIVDEIKRQAREVAKELKIKGLMNVRFMVKDGDVYIFEITPRASRTIPFVSKATGVAWAKVAAKVIIGKSLKEQGVTEVAPALISVKEAVFPFTRFPGVDVVLGPEMRSTGEVMGMDASFGGAFIKAEIAAGQKLPEKGTAFVSVADRDKSAIGEIGKKLNELGFDIAATRGTAKALQGAGVNVRVIPKIGEGRPDATDLIKNGEIDLIINTLSGKKPRKHEISIRSAMAARDIPIVSTIAGAKATLLGMETARRQGAEVRSLQEK